MHSIGPENSPIQQFPTDKKPSPSTPPQRQKSDAKVGGVFSQAVPTRPNSSSPPAPPPKIASTSPNKAPPLTSLQAPQHSPEAARASLEELAATRGNENLPIGEFMDKLEKLHQAFKTGLTEEPAPGCERHKVYRGLFGPNELLEMVESGLLRNAGVKEATGLTREKLLELSKTHRGNAESIRSPTSKMFSSATVSTTSSMRVAHGFSGGISQENKLWVSLILESKKDMCVISVHPLEQELTFPADAKIIGISVHNKMPL